MTRHPGKSRAPLSLSGWHTLDDGDVARGGDDSGQAEAVGGEEPPILRLGPLEAPEQDHHVQVEQLAERRPVALRQDVLDEQELRPGRHRAAEVIEDESGLGVIPVVDDVAEQVGVGTAGAVLKKSPPSTAQRPATPAAFRRGRARSTTCGWSNSRPRIAG